MRYLECFHLHKDLKQKREKWIISGHIHKWWNSLNVELRNYQNLKEVSLLRASRKHRQGDEEEASEGLPPFMRLHQGEICIHAHIYTYVYLWLQQKTLTFCKNDIFITEKNVKSGRAVSFVHVSITESGIGRDPELSGTLGTCWWYFSRWVFATMIIISGFVLDYSLLLLFSSSQRTWNWYLGDKII